MDDLPRVGGDLCLDYVNTVDTWQHTDRVDYLSDYRALVAWAARAGGPADVPGRTAPRRRGGAPTPSPARPRQRGHAARCPVPCARPRRAPFRSSPGSRSSTQSSSPPCAAAPTTRTERLRARLDDQRRARPDALAGAPGCNSARDLARSRARAIVPGRGLRLALPRHQQGGPASLVQHGDLRQPDEDETPPGPCPTRHARVNATGAPSVRVIGASSVGWAGAAVGPAAMRGRQQVTGDLGRCSELRLQRLARRDPLDPHEDVLARSHR